MMMEALARRHSHAHPAPCFLGRRPDDGRRTRRAVAANNRSFHIKKQRLRVIEASSSGVDAGVGIALLERYEDVLAAAPVATKCVTSWVGFTVADAVAQLLAFTGPFAGIKKEGEDVEEEGIPEYCYDFRRTLRMGLFGLAFYGPVSGL